MLGVGIASAKVIPDPSGPGATKTYIVQASTSYSIGKCLSVKFTLKEDVEGITLYVVNKYGDKYSVELKSYFKLAVVGPHEICVAFTDFQLDYHSNYIDAPYTYDVTAGVRAAGIIFWDSQKDPKPTVENLKIELNS